MGLKDRILGAVVGAAAGAAWDAISKSIPSGPSNSADPLPIPNILGSNNLSTRVDQLKSASDWSTSFKATFQTALSGDEAEAVLVALVHQAQAKRDAMDAGPSNAEARRNQELSAVTRKSAEEAWKKAAKKLVNAVSDYKGTVDPSVKSDVIATIANLAATDKVSRAPAAEKDPEGWATIHAYGVKRDMLGELSRALSRK